MLGVDRSRATKSRGVRSLLRILRFHVVLLQVEVVLRKQIQVLSAHLTARLRVTTAAGHSRQGNSGTAIPRQMTSDLLSWVLTGILLPDVHVGRLNRV